MTALGQHFKARGITPKSWFFNTDGAPSHFKNRFTMHSLFKFKTKIGATTVVWETCAPGHGKGPWDGIGAVIKSLIRRLELHEKIYVQGARDVFLALQLESDPEFLYLSLSTTMSSCRASHLSMAMQMFGHVSCALQ